jgi:hypothetical protein
MRDASTGIAVWLLAVTVVITACGGRASRGPDGGFITGSDILMDGGVTAVYWYGELAPQ